MNLPILKERRNRMERQTTAFVGVNYSDNFREGELEESLNLTSERFPILSQRAGRAVLGNYENATAVYYKGKRFVVDGTKLLYDDVQIGTVSKGKKQFAAVNSKVVIFPDKIYYDTATGEVRSLGAEYMADGGSVEIVNRNAIAVHLGSFYATVKSSGNIGGNDEDNLTIDEDERPFTSKLSSVSVNADTGEITFGETSQCPYAENVETGMLFVDASLGADGVTTWGKVTQKYSEPIRPVGPGQTSTATYDKGFDYDIYTVVGADYETFAGFEALNFRTGDAVEIEGMTTYPDYNGSYLIRGFGTYTTGDGVQLPTLVFDNDVFAENGTEAGAVTIRRKVPNLSVICESNNRLWGAEGNTIYASALGDPTNFFTYDGLDTDSYAVAVASEGVFTGCCGFGTSILFWKEDRLIKILGSYPSQYTMYEYRVPGVKKGSEGSLQNINETLYYHSREGVYRYNGGSPELISENFGLRRFRDASAGAEGDRYYISMQDESTEEWGLWVYDVQRGIWLREDESRGACFTYHDGKLQFVNGAGALVCVNPDASEEVIAWSATTTRMNETYLNRKCYSRLLLRLDIAKGAWLQVEISCDDGPWRKAYIDYNSRAKTCEIPIIPNRCDNFRVRLSGEGQVRILDMVREFRISQGTR